MFSIPGNLKKTLFNLLIFLILLSGICSGWVKAQSFFSLKPKKTHYTLDFEFTRNLILIPIMVNNRGPYHFIFDTGISFMLITNPEIADQSGTRTNKFIPITGFGSLENISAQILNGLNLEIGKIKGQNFSAAYLPPSLLDFSSFLGVRVDGIIGYDLAKDFQIKIDFPKKTLVFKTEKEAFNTRKYTKIPLSIQNSHALVEACLKSETGSKKVQLVLDTGAGNSVFLYAKSINGFIPPTLKLSASLGWGINGPITGYLARFPLFSLKTLELKNIISAFPQLPDSLSNASPQEGNGNGNLGNEILKRFTLILDYESGFLYLKKNFQFRTSFEYDMSGMVLVSTGEPLKRITIAHIDAKSPAEEGGLLEGDWIVEINDKISTQYSLDDLDTLLKSGNKKKIYLVVFREGKFLDRTLILKRRI